MLETIQAAGERVLEGRLAAGFDIAAVDPDGRGAREPSPLGCGLVDNQDGA
jgi:hypothetical protein